MRASDQYLAQAAQVHASMQARAMSSYQNQLLAAGIGGQQPAGYNDALNPLVAFIGNAP